MKVSQIIQQKVQAWHGSIRQTEVETVAYESRFSDASSIAFVTVFRAVSTACSIPVQDKEDLFLYIRTRDNRQYLLSLVDISFPMSGPFFSSMFSQLAIAFETGAIWTQRNDFWDVVYNRIDCPHPDVIVHPFWYLDYDNWFSFELPLPYPPAF